MKFVGLRLVTAFLFAASLHGCAAKDSTSRPLIVKGHKTDAKLYPAVALQERGDDGVYESFCSGVMLTGRHLLTAAHCSLDRDGSASNPVDVAVVAADNDPDGAQALRHSVKSITVEPGYLHDADDGDDDDDIVRPGDAHDIAIWTLHSAIPNVRTAAVLAESDLETAFVDGRSVVIMGYGKQGRWEKPWAKHPLHMAETKYFEYLGSSSDDPDEHSEKIPGRTNTEFYAGGEGLPDTCNGDSGGPAFIKSDSGALRLVGVTSRGLPSCDRGGVYTMVPAYIDWIMNEVAGLSIAGL